MRFRIVRHLFFLLFPLVFSSTLHADNKNSIEGEILFSEKGTIYVYLVNEEIFETPLTGLKTLVLDPKKEDIKNRKIAFTFHDLKDGTYGIRCFQDQNGDGKLNKGMFGPSEPWGMSWKNEKVTRWPSFDKIAFKVTSDVKDIVIKLE